jgi:hypothetical protein
MGEGGSAGDGGGSLGDQALPGEERWRRSASSPGCGWRRVALSGMGAAHEQEARRESGSRLGAAVPGGEKTIRGLECVTSGNCG